MNLISIHDAMPTIHQPACNWLENESFFSLTPSSAPSPCFIAMQHYVSLKTLIELKMHSFNTNWWMWCHLSHKIRISNHMKPEAHAILLIKQCSDFRTVFNSISLTDYVNEFKGFSISKLTKVKVDGNGGQIKHYHTWCRIVNSIFKPFSIYALD